MHRAVLLLLLGSPLPATTLHAQRGVEVRCDGQVMRVPATPGLHARGEQGHAQLPGAGVQRRRVRVQRHRPAPGQSAARLRLPEEMTSPEWSGFLCYTEWGSDYRYVEDNVIDPMHGTFVHKQSHSMSEGDISAKFQLRRTEHGFMFDRPASAVR